MEFGARVLDAETPIDGGPGGIAPGFVSNDGNSQCRLFPATSLQAVARQYDESERNSPPSESQQQSLLSSSSKEQVTPW